MPIPPRTKNFTIAIRQSGPAALVHISGSLTSFESGALRDAICGLIAKKHNDIVLNLGGLEYLDSSGIGELVRNYLTVIKSGGTVKGVGLWVKGEGILRITPLFTLFSEISQQQSALRNVTPQRSETFKT